jgi:superfamily II DNA or RNA helicase
MSSKCDIFLRCLEFAILNSPYSKVVLKPKQVICFSKVVLKPKQVICLSKVVLKPKQVICLEKLYLNSDVLAVLPTGFGKSLIFHLLPALLYAKKDGISKGPTNILSIVVVVSPLNALIMNQISKLDASGVRASALDVKYLS